MPEDLKPKYHFVFDHVDHGFCRIYFKVKLETRTVNYCYMDGNLYSCTNDWLEPECVVTPKVLIKIDTPVAGYDLDQEIVNECNKFIDEHPMLIRSA